MSCRTIEPLLAAAIDDRLAQATRHEVDDHVKSCAACAGQLAAMRQTRSALAACGRAEPPADQADRIVGHVFGALAEQDLPPRSFWDRFVAVAIPATLVATVGAAALALLMMRTPDSLDHRAETAPSGDPVEQISSTDREADEQLASNVLGMEVEP